MDNKLCNTNDTLYKHISIVKNSTKLYMAVNVHTQMNCSKKNRTHYACCAAIQSHAISKLGITTLPNLKRVVSGAV